MNYSPVIFTCTNVVVSLIATVLTCAIFVQQATKLAVKGSVFFWKKYVVTTFIKLHTMYLLLDVLSEEQMELENNFVSEARLVDISCLDLKDLDVTETLIRLEKKTLDGFSFSLTFDAFLGFLVKASAEAEHRSQDKNVLSVSITDLEGLTHSALFFPGRDVFFPLRKNVLFCCNLDVCPCTRISKACIKTQGSTIDITSLVLPYNRQVVRVMELETKEELEVLVKFFVHLAYKRKLVLKDVFNQACSVHFDK